MKACVLAVLLGLAGGLALADTITLDNGKTLRGKIVRRQGGQVVIELDNGGRITIPESRVVLVEPDAGTTTQPPTGPTKPVVPAGQPEKQPSPGSDSKPPAGGDSAEAPDPKLQARITALVEQLGGKGEEGNRDAADAARAELVRIGEPALEALCKALEDPNGWRRLYAAKAVGEIGSKKAARALLAALWAGTPPKGEKVVWWDRMFLRACADSLAKITGASFGYDSNSVLAGEQVEKMLDWWKANHKDYPEQVGAPPVKAGEEGGEKAPDPVEEIKKLPPRKFPAPASALHGQ